MDIAKVFTRTICCSAFTLALFSCSNITGEKGLQGVQGIAPDSAKATLTLRVNSGGARTILAESIELSDMSYTLNGVLSDSSGTEQKIGDWDSYSEMTSDSAIMVDIGSWTFTLTASKDGAAVYSGTTTVEVVAGENVLDFTLQPAAEEGGKGNVKVKISFPDDADVATVTAELLNVDYGKVEGFELTDLTISGNSATYSVQDVTAGNYVIQFRFYNSSGSELKPMYNEVIQVKNGRTSSAERKIDEFEKVQEEVTQPDVSANLHVTIEEQSDIGTLEYDKSAGTLSLALSDGYTVYKWRVDGEEQDEKSGTLSLGALNLSAGIHFVMVIVKDSNGDYYSASYAVKLEEVKGTEE